ncbi:hypothetical protein NC651_039591 [Populus alba x Populus x berolinensis]|nr:hypothetical protein NC651_039591 [Populus alba x Populus x berolinensis]
MDALESEFLDWKTIFEKRRENGNVLTRHQTGLLGLTSLLEIEGEKVDITISEINPSLCPWLSSTKPSKDTTLNSESEDEDSRTVNDDKAIPSDHPHPWKADVHDVEIIINRCLDRLEKAAIFDPNAATNMPVHPLSLFPEIMEFEKQQNVLDCTTLLLAILALEETELQEKALVLQPNSCMG